MINVMLVDDDIELLENMELILTYQDKMNIIGKAIDGKDALQQLEQTQPDIILLDLNMKGMGGIEVIPYLKEHHKSTKILVLTTFYDDHYITEAIKRGADGYLLKDSNPDNIIDAVKQILAGQSILDHKVMEKLAKMMMPKPMMPKPMMPKPEVLMEQFFDISSLTKREIEICALLSEGYTNVSIANQLYISEGTVKNYISSIYDKLGIHDRATLVVKLRENYNK